MQASLKLRGNNRSSKRRWAHYLDAGGRESLRSLKRPCCPEAWRAWVAAADLGDGRRRQWRWILKMSCRWGVAACTASGWRVTPEEAAFVGVEHLRRRRRIPASPHLAPPASPHPASSACRRTPREGEGGPDRLDAILTSCPRAKPLLPIHGLKWAKSEIRPAPILLKHSPIQSYPLFRKAHNES